MGETIELRRVERLNNKPLYEQQGIAMTCRSFEEYMRMFTIEWELLTKGSILDVAAGASSFVAATNAKGLHAVAADPLYVLNPEWIELKGKEEIEISTAKLARLQEQFDWAYYGDINNHRAMREASLNQFISDYRSMRDSRYIAAKLPDLPFSDESFELVLCSHFLFLYGEQMDLAFHKRAIKELLRVCRKGGQVRVYPLYNLSFQPYPGLSMIIEELSAAEVEVRFHTSELPFIPGSFELLSLVKR